MIKKIIISVLILIFSQNIMMAADKNLDAAYLIIMQQAIQSNWVRPLSEMRKSVIVQFTINNSGQVCNVSVVKSSNNDEFDKSAILAVYKSVPFKEFSADIYDTETATFQIFLSNYFVSLSKIDNNQSVLNSSLPPDANYVAYMRNLEQRVQSNWEQSDYPKDEAAITAFTINKNGAIAHLHVLRSSGSDKFDNLALDAVRKSNPVDSFPDYVKDDSIQVQFAFFYNPLRDSNAIQYTTSLGLLDKESNLVKTYETYKKQITKVLNDSLTTKACYKITEVVVAITIDKNGQIIALNIEKPSIDKNFDKNVADSLSQASFPAIPISFNMDKFSFKCSVKTKTNDSFSQAYREGKWFGAKQYDMSVLWD